MKLRTCVARRLADIDAAGVDLQVLSHSVPASEAFPAEQAVRLAQRTNEQEGPVWLVGWRSPFAVSWAWAAWRRTEGRAVAAPASMPTCGA
jgi:hypothetical protein